MVTVVIVLNCLIACVCLFAAWQMLKLRRKLAGIANMLIAAERSTHAVLSKAPNTVIKGQSGIYQLRQRYQQLEPQVQRLRQVMVLLRLGQTIWLWRSPNRSRSFFQSRRRVKR
jgi:hypothetical protein